MKISHRGFEPKRLSWWFSFVFDGDDEDGDPSGIFLVIAGLTIEHYWEMHRKIEIVVSLGEKPRVNRW